MTGVSTDTVKKENPLVIRWKIAALPRLLSNDSQRRRIGVEGAITAKLAPQDAAPETIELLIQTIAYHSLTPHLEPNLLVLSYHWVTRIDDHTFHAGTSRFVRIRSVFLPLNT